MKRRPIIAAAPIGSRARISAAAVWPLRGVDGLTFAERKRNLPLAIADIKESGI